MLLCIIGFSSLDLSGSKIAQGFDQIIAFLGLSIGDQQKNDLHRKSRRPSAFPGLPFCSSMSGSLSAARPGEMSGRERSVLFCFNVVLTGTVVHSQFKTKPYIQSSDGSFADAGMGISVISFLDTSHLF